MRLFLALECSPQVVDALMTVCRELKSFWGARVRIGRADQLHLTLRFLGETEEGLIAALCDRVAREITSIQSFFIEFDSLGVFPEEGTARVLWIGCKAPELEIIAAGTEKAAQACGFPPEERHFRPHITLARAKAGLSPLEARERFKCIELPSLGFKATHVTLYKSEQSPRGSLYSIVAHMPLKG